MQPKRGDVLLTQSCLLTDVEDCMLREVPEMLERMFEHFRLFVLSPNDYWVGRVNSMLNEQVRYLEPIVACTLPPAGFVWVDDCPHCLQRVQKLGYRCIAIVRDGFYYGEPDITITSLCELTPDHVCSLLGHVTE